MRVKRLKHLLYEERPLRAGTYPRGGLGAMLPTCVSSCRKGVTGPEAVAVWGCNK